MAKPVTLGSLLKEFVGVKIVVELKDETVVEGTLYSCDNKSFNIELENAVFYRRRSKNLVPLKLEYFFVKGFHIRFIHFNSYSEVLSGLKRSMRKK